MRQAIDHAACPVGLLGETLSYNHEMWNNENFGSKPQAIPGMTIEGRHVLGKEIQYGSGRCTLWGRSWLWICNTCQCHELVKIGIDTGVTTEKTMTTQDQLACREQYPTYANQAFSTLQGNSMTAHVKMLHGLKCGLTTPPTTAPTLAPTKNPTPPTKTPTSRRPTRVPTKRPTSGRCTGCWPGTRGSCKGANRICYNKQRGKCPGGTRPC